METLSSYKRIRLVRSPIWIPPRQVEYLYFFAVFYSILSGYLGIEVPLVATSLFAALAGFCIIQSQAHLREVYGPVGLLFACGISLILVQMVFHEGPLLESTHREFINWMLGLVIVQSLFLREGFLHRLALVLVMIGVVVLPHLAFNTEAIERARIEIQVSGNLKNANGLAEWFGYCLVYFAVYGLENRRSAIIRIGSWAMAFGCLYVVGLTVSRGPLLASALALTVGFRRILRRGFAPVLVLIILVWITYESGLFDSITAHYISRGEVETGREKLWPDAIERLSASPITLLIGVGMSNIGSQVLGAMLETPPHNSFLFFALSSGAVPLAFYVAFWIQAAWRSFSRSRRSEDDAFRLPLLIFTFEVIMSGDTGFMSPWGLLALSLAAGSNVSYQIRELILVRSSEGVRILQPLRDRPKPTNSVLHT